MNTHDDLLNYNEDMCFLPQDDIEDVCLQRNDDTRRVRDLFKAIELHLSKIN